MLVTVELDISRDDGVVLKGEKADEMREALEQALGEISLPEIVKNEGRSTEESVTVSISVERIEDKNLKMHDRLVSAQSLLKEATEPLLPWEGEKQLKQRFRTAQKAYKVLEGVRI